MAKFCGNCGTKLDDNAKVCGQCGTPLDGKVEMTKLKIEDPEKKKKAKKIIKIVSCFIVIAIVAVVAINVIFAFTGYNGLLKKVMHAYEKYDIETLASLSSDIFYYDEDVDIEDYYEDCVGDDLDLFEDSVGHNYKLSYEIDEVYELSERKFNELIDELESSYPEFDFSEIKDCVIAEVIVTAQQESNSEEVSLTVIMTKENNSWKLLIMR